MVSAHHDGDRPQPDDGDRAQSDPNAGASARPGSALRKLAAGAIGGTVTAAGIVMLVTPGPGVIVTFAGMTILAREFPAVRNRLDGWRDMASSRFNRQ